MAGLTPVRKDDHVPRFRAPTAVLEPDSLVTHAYRRLANHILDERRP
ncbi:MAG: hypothetical protein ACLP0J_22935 [Solirubrobacteraceae bacterium]